VQNSLWGRNFLRCLKNSGSADVPACAVWL
jgi:hypothetical protein